jgi:hypothetical protein
MTISFPENLTLLLSVDIVGSAAFKASATQQEGTPSWVRAFEAFYDQVPRMLQEQRQGLADALAPNLQLWKAIGDQLVFLARPQHPDQLEAECLAFLRGLRRSNQVMRERWGFCLHGVVWGFPEGGANVSFRFSQPQLSGGAGFDLIGPDVDLGFRLVSFAPDGDVLAPLELRRLLPLKRLRLDLIGEASLKGIPLDPYPLLLLQEQCLAP